MKADEAAIDAALDDLAWCAANVRGKRWGKQAQRALGMATLKIVGSLAYDNTKEQDDSYEKLLARWERIAKKLGEEMKL